MYSAEKKIVIAAASLAVATVAASLCLVFFEGMRQSAPQIIFANMFILLLLMIAVMAVSLRASVRETLYSYKNISLIAGILFASAFAVVNLVYFIGCMRAGEISVRHIYQAALEFPRQFSYYAVFVLVAVSLLIAVSNIALIRREGFRLHNALSALFAAFYVGGTVLIYALSDLLEKYVFASGDPVNAVINAVISLFLLLMLCYFECIFVGSAIMGWAAARRKPKYDKDYIIILGCSIDKKGGLLPLLKGRVNRAIRFAWEQEIATGKPMKYVPSGGQGPNEIMSEGSAMELYLMTRGAEDYEIFPEKESKDTWENMCFSKKIIDGLKPDAKVAFATTNYHILRSGILARKAGLDAEGIAGDTKWYFWPNGFLREFFGILALNVKAHITAAAVAAAVCIAAGAAGYFGSLL